MTGTVEGRPLDESELVERARSGDHEAYAELVHAYQAIAFRTAFLIAGGATEAEDAAQDGFVKAWRALGRFRAGAPFRPWLLRIVANEAHNRRRSAGRRTRLALRAAAAEPSGDAAPSPELPDDQRIVVSLRYFVGLGEEEVAETLGIAQGTVKSRTSRALERLRESYD